MDKILNGMILFKFYDLPLNDCGYYEKYSSFSELNQVWDKKNTQTLVTRINTKNLVDKENCGNRYLIFNKNRNATMVKHQIVQIPC
jgi:hypothetical protein